MAIGRAMVVQEEPQPSYQMIFFSDVPNSSNAAVAEPQAGSHGIMIYARRHRMGHAR